VRERREAYHWCVCDSLGPNLIVATRVIGYRSDTAIMVRTPNVRTGSAVYSDCVASPPLAKLIRSRTIDLVRYKATVH
jgi:hypothetical protein